MAKKKTSTKKVTSTKKNLSKKPEKKEEVVKKEPVEDDEPSWYHYLTIILVIIGLFVGAYFIFEYVDSRSDADVGTGNKQYLYEHKVGKITYNIYFTVPISELEKLSYPVEVTERDLFNTASVRLSFQEYNGTDNGYVSVSAIKLRRFLDTVYHFSFEQENFAQFNETNCTNSTNLNRIVTFDPYQNTTGVFVEEDSGCITFATQEADEMRVLVDYFIYETIREDGN